MYEFFDHSDDVCQEDGDREVFSFASPELNVGVCGELVYRQGDSAQSGQQVLKVIERGIRAGLGLKAAIADFEQVDKMAVSNARVLGDKVRHLFVCKVGVTGYELACFGVGCVYLFQDGRLNPIFECRDEVNSPDKANPGFSMSDVSFLRGEMNVGDTLMMCCGQECEVLNSDQSSALIPISVDVATLGMQLANQIKSARENARPGIVLARKEQECEYDTGEVLCRLPIDQSRYQSKSQSRPLFLLVLLVSIVIILTTL